MWWSWFVEVELVCGGCGVLEVDAAATCLPEIRFLLVGLLALPLLADPHSLGLDLRQLVSLVYLRLGCL